MKPKVTPRRTSQTIFLGILSITLAVIAMFLPSWFNLKLWGGGFFTGSTYATMVFLLFGSLIMGLLERSFRRASGWALLIGLAPLVDMVIRMSKEGPGNLWPIAIVLALVMGLTPALIGAFIGCSTRKVVNSLRSRSRPRIGNAVATLGGILFLILIISNMNGHSETKSTYWGFKALAPSPPNHTTAVEQCNVTTAIPNLPEITGSITVRSEVGFWRSQIVNGQVKNHDNYTIRSLLTLTRLANSDSVEFVISNDMMRLTFCGTMTNEDEASGTWSCTDMLPGSPDSTLVVDGSWVLRRGSWPTEKLAWPSIPGNASELLDTVEIGSAVQ